MSTTRRNRLRARSVHAARRPRAACVGKPVPDIFEVAADPHPEPAFAPPHGYRAVRWCACAGQACEQT